MWSTASELDLKLLKLSTMCKVQIAVARATQLSRPNVGTIGSLQCMHLSLLSPQTKTPLAIVVWSHWPEMKISGRCSPWNFTKKYCTYTCHTLRVHSPPKVPLRPLSQTFLRIPKQYFVFVSSPKNKPTLQSATIVLTLWISYRTEDELQSCILVWRDSKKRCVHCN